MSNPKPARQTRAVPLFRRFPTAPVAASLSAPSSRGRKVRMPLLLSRFARTLAAHWKRSLAGAVVVLVLLVLAAAGAGDATDDYAIPGTESQEAVDLFKAHSPAFGGVDSTLVFTVDEGKVSDPAPRAAIEGALAEVGALDGVALVADPFAPGGQVSADGRLAAVDVRYSLGEGEIAKADGEALIAAGETAEPEVQVGGPRDPGRPGRRAGRADRRARRRPHRDRAADPAVPLRGGDDRDAHRRADGCRGGADPPGRGVRAARAPDLHDRARGDARPRRGHRLRAAHHRPLPGAASGRRQPAGRRRPRGGDVGHDRRRSRADRDGGARRPARGGRPVHRQDGPRLCARRRRRGRGGADDPPDHDGRLRPPARAEEGRARPGLARVHAVGRVRHPPPVGVDRRRRRGPAGVRVPGHRAAHRPARRRQPARVGHPAGRVRPAERRRSVPVRAGRSCSRSTRPRTLPRPRRS